MRVLLLHPDDAFHGSWTRQHWDSVIDLGRAPRSFYDERSAELGCSVFSVFDLAVEVADLQTWRQLLELGMGQVVDRFGIDWWDVISHMLHPELQDVRLALRLAEKLSGCRTLAVSRPSAYSNVTRTALSYAKILPEQKFLLVLARESEAVSPVPANVETTRLAAFATNECDRNELQKLENCWRKMEQSLQQHPAFRLPVQIGILKKGPRWLRWGLAVRDAWVQVFETRSVAGCLSADDSNPYTRIPLLLAEQRGIPAVACHHGALDCRMAFKNLRFSTYLAKGEMERDYLERGCGVSGGRIRIGAAAAAAAGQENASLWREDAPWIVFFTEPYETDFWRAEAIYREVLPRLCAAARDSGKTVMLKLHPFESARQRRRLVKRTLNERDRKLVSVTDAPLSGEILRNTWCAVTVESTVAFECASRGIPAFLCGWLRHAYSGYAPQYVRFGAGRMLESPDDLLRISDMLGSAMPGPDSARRLVQAISPEALSEVLCPPARSGLRSMYDSGETGA